jgi:predicted Fe-S protein YdhL (DUF1289 family)
MTPMSTHASLAAIATPCVQICVLDPLSALCIGCGRSVAEIAAWGAMSESERTGIMGELGERLRLMRSRSRRSGRVGPREPD